MKINLAYLFLFLFSFTSCVKEFDKNSEPLGTIQLGFSMLQAPKTKGLASNDIPAKIVISINDSKGVVAIESKKLSVSKKDNSYLSEAISLKSDNYIITKFIVLNSTDSVIYASPLNGSQLASFVKLPSPITFSINENTATKLSPEVISVQNAKPQDFGYADIYFATIKTFDFLANVMVYNDKQNVWELSAAHISIHAADQSNAQEKDLDAKSNPISLPDYTTNYVLTVSKAGYPSYTDTIAAADLKLHFKSEDKGPLIIRLVADPSLVVDVDGNIYHTIKIGGQIWLSENLAVTKYNDCTEIPYLNNLSQAYTTTSPKYVWHNHDSIKDARINGALYNWYAINTGKLAPKGCRVPTYSDWETLINYLGGVEVAGGKLKERGTSHWESPNIVDAISTGFNAVSGGAISSKGIFYSQGMIGNYFSSTEADATHAGYVAFTFAASSMKINKLVLKTNLCSIRCIKTF